MHIEDGMKPYFKLAGWLGIVVLILDTWLSGMFGWSSSLMLAAVYAAISIASGVLMVVAIWFFLQDNIWMKRTGKVLAAAWVFAFMFNVMSNMGVATAVRMADVQTAGVKKAVHAEKDKSRSEAERNVAFFEKRKAELDADLKKAAQAEICPEAGSKFLKCFSVGVAPSSPEALVEVIKAKTDEVANEAKRVKCDRICDQRKKELAHLVKLQEMAKDFQKNHDQHAAALDGLANARNALASTDKGISQTANQSALYAKIGLFLTGNGYSDDPSESAVANANEGMGIAAAFVLALLSVALTLASAIPHLPFGGNRHQFTTLSDVAQAPNKPLAFHQRPALVSDSLSDRFANSFKASAA